MQGTLPSGHLPTLSSALPIPPQPLSLVVRLSPTLSASRPLLFGGALPFLFPGEFLLLSDLPTAPLLPRGCCLPTWALPLPLAEVACIMRLCVSLCDQHLPQALGGRDWTCPVYLQLPNSSHTVGAQQTFVETTSESMNDRGGLWSMWPLPSWSLCDGSLIVVAVAGLGAPGGRLLPSPQGSESSLRLSPSCGTPSSCTRAPLALPHRPLLGTLCMIHNPGPCV